MKFKIFILLLVQQIIYAQNIQIEYISYIDNIVAVNIPTRLMIDEKNSRALYIVEINKTESASYQNDKSLIDFMRQKQPSVSLYDKNAHTLRSFGMIGKEEVEIIDYLPKIDWQITNELKTILDFKCVKAVGQYRGRKWTAWFSYDIPINIGPSKFHGLPGIVLELYDESKRFQFNAKKVIKTKNDFLSEFENYIAKQKRINNAKSLQEVEDSRKVYAEAFASEQNQRGDRLSVKENKRTGIELIYEWEEEAKK